MVSQLLMLGDKLNASQMQTWGLVNQVCAPGQALADALALADRINARAPNAMGSIKELVNAASQHDLFAQLPLEKQHFVNNLHHPNAGIGIAAEYLVGHQTDINNNYGLTHHASAEVLLLGTVAPKRIKPYAMLGMGFLEFKSFTQDKYGIAYHAAAGIEIEYSPKIKGFIEPRYLNLSQMKLGGQHELVVTWGVRFAFSDGKVPH
jgi:hypothetical protein